MSYHRPKLIYLALVFILLILLFSSRQLIKASDINEKWYNIILLPLYLSFSSLFLSTMIPITSFKSASLVQMLYFLTVIMLYYYYRHLYFFLINPKKYEKGTLENFSSYCNFFSVYLMISVVFGINSFLNVQNWILMLFVLLFTAVVVYQVMWVNNILTKSSYFYISLICLVIFEFAWSIFFLILSYYIR